MKNIVWHGIFAKAMNAEEISRKMGKYKNPIVSSKVEKVLKKRNVSEVHVSIFDKGDSFQYEIQKRQLLTDCLINIGKGNNNEV